ncbi:hypothetical protein [Streptomyces sp. GMR22]|uniref:hypothetical protein n=1 Tax=Streptomyces sp. GMR22 TaxID=2759524 RepID=UPI0015FB8694|nr:hypothetical protein [Streptomyces sp. GMR22]MBA6435838.1 hypothetical protein [Streptomyces sp. GMR22]
MERPPLLPRTALALAATAALIAPAAVAYGAERSPQAPAASWSLKWNPASGASVASAFEGAEDDRADSHPGVTHIYPYQDGFRTDIHYPKDVDTSTDRQRQEVRGMKQGGSAVKILKNETWRIQYQMYVPDTLDATTGFTHIMQIKVGDVAAPLFTMSLHQHSDGPKVEIRTSDDDDNLTEAGAADMAPLQGTWSDVSVEVKAADSGAYADWSVTTGGRKVAAYKRTGLDLWRGKNYLRPKWGIYRSLNSSGLQTTYLLTRNFKAYKLQ